MRTTASRVKTSSGKVEPLCACVIPNVTWLRRLEWSTSYGGMEEPKESGVPAAANHGGYTPKSSQVLWEDGATQTS
ncbi:hypothetical protein NDU88_000656 [Pleurodeles waltl]|uniref:Uncharacterized protein n=1 Tax=Pleurodeles waltl TaxID=8319 RepID=A0AAV7N8K5_PLEWA|nr:hypothetical protein NDU88_000656 [Pleurodeles waltl]